jgi:hypothetical protein
MAVVKADSIIQCSIFCGDGCSCFGFNSTVGTCHTHASCDPQTITVEEPGWRYFMNTGKHVLQMITHSCTYLKF